jgi:hypothetical protein
MSFVKASIGKRGSLRTAGSCTVPLLDTESSVRLDLVGDLVVESADFETSIVSGRNCLMGR